MFDEINKELVILKDGVVNILTGQSLSKEQAQLITFDKQVISVFDEAYKENNTFTLYRAGESASTRSSKIYFLSIISLLQ